MNVPQLADNGTEQDWRAIAESIRRDLDRMTAEITTARYEAMAMTAWLIGMQEAYHVR